jgi:hypothetical protein
MGSEATISRMPNRRERERNAIGAEPNKGNETGENEND